MSAGKSVREKVMLVGERLKAVRESKNLSQGHIEQRTGLLRCYVSRVENMHTVPSIDTLEKWAKALDISMAELFSETGKAPKPLVVFKGKNGHRLSSKETKMAERVNDLIGRMRTRDQNLLLNMARQLARRAA
jgi:transcriptional regulator with XRE-family HTH domain